MPYTYTNNAPATNLKAPPASTKYSFFRLVANSKTDRLYAIIALLGMITQFTIFKLLYPYPDFFSDSYSYIFGAYANLEINIWPIGYSKFLRAFHVLTDSHTLLIAFQYFFFELAALYFYFSISYFFKLSKVSRVVLFAFLFFNPLFLYVCNYVNSDPLFIALSVLWLTELIHIVFRYRHHHLIAHAILLFFCFTVRNNAYYYPIVSIVAFLLCTTNWKLKLTGIILPFLLIVPFINHSRTAAEDLTGTKQFSLFTGWQLANNALYMYDKIHIDPATLPDSSMVELDRSAKLMFQFTGDNYHDYLAAYVGNLYIRESYSPLKQYMNRHFKTDDDYSIVTAWGKSSAVFNKFGSFIITKYPLAFLKYYVSLNTKNYFQPPLEKLEIYNLGLSNISSIAQFWFNLESPKVTSVSNKLQGRILYFYPLFFLFLNLYTIGYSILFALSVKRKQFRIRDQKIIFLLSLFLVLNAAFSILATIIVFRYEIFPMVVGFVLAILLTELFDQIKSQPTQNHEPIRN